MAANVQPIFTRTPNNGSVLVAAANTANDGTGNLTTGPTMYKAWTAGADGGYIDEIWIALVANAANLTPQAALNIVRLYVSSIGTGATTSADTHLIHEEQFAAGLVASQSTAASTLRRIPIKRPIRATWTVLASVHLVAAANTGYKVSVWGGDY